MIEQCMWTVLYLCDLLYHIVAYYRWVHKGFHQCIFQPSAQPMGWVVVEQQKKKIRESNGGRLMDQNLFSGFHVYFIYAIYTFF